MQLGMIGLGRMGGNMAKRIAAAGHEVVGYDRSPESDRTVASLKELVAALKAPRLVWVMVPAGEATDSTINELAELLQPGDMIIDGGNSRYTDDARHAAELEPKGIHFMDCGVSGGVWGIDRGYALMVGGSQGDFESARPIFEALKPEGDSGLVLAGPVGGGHFAKMVHNGIEYGMMQAFGEGFATMVKSDLVEDPAAVMSSWRDGSVVQSWLLDLLAHRLQVRPDAQVHAAGRQRVRRGEVDDRGGSRTRRADPGHRGRTVRTSDLARRRRRHPARRVHHARPVRRPRHQDRRDRHPLTDSRINRFRFLPSP